MLWTYWHSLKNAHAIASRRPQNQQATNILSLGFCLEYGVTAFLCLASFLVCFCASLPTFFYLLQAHMYVPLVSATIRYGDYSSICSEFCVLHRWSSDTSTHWYSALQPLDTERLRRFAPKSAFCSFYIRSKHRWCLVPRRRYTVVPLVPCGGYHATSL